MDNDYPVLYVFVRSDMPSMSPGKAQAHSGHAANAFTHDYVIMPITSTQSIDPIVNEWMTSTKQGFGTQINLKAPWSDVERAVTTALSLNFKADFVTDPTYPYVVNDEIFGLIPPNVHTDTPINIGNGNYACFRRERTAAYIFGMKSQLVDIVGQFPLHP